MLLSRPISCDNFGADAEGNLPPPCAGGPRAPFQRWGWGSPGDGTESGV